MYNDATEYQNWFKRITQKYDEISEGYIKELNNFFSNYGEILKEFEETNEQFSWNFSIFNIISSNRPEENIHTPFIAELLNSEGDHGQGDLFFKLFLEIILTSQRLTDFQADYEIKTEEWINGKNGKGEIDITIKSVDEEKPFVIIIENKWDSKDSCYDQIYKYYKYYQSEKAYSKDNILVLYLTKGGVEPDKVNSKEFRCFLEKERNITYFPISYKTTIYKWLLSCEEDCQSEKVTQTIAQYKQHIKNL